AAPDRRGRDRHRLAHRGARCAGHRWRDPAARRGELGFLRAERRRRGVLRRRVRCRLRPARGAPGEATGHHGARVAARQGGPPGPARGAGRRTSGPLPRRTGVRRRRLDGDGRSLRPPSGIVRVLAAVGQRSLSFYLLQSVLLAPLLASWGLGLSPQLSTASAVGIALAAWLARLPLAAWMDSREIRGPAERPPRRETHGTHDPRSRP